MPSPMKSFKLACLSLTLLGAAVAQPTVFSGGVINGASFIPNQPVAVGSVVSIFGSGLAAKTIPAETVPLSMVMGQTAVFINGELAPLFFVSDGQINAQLPWDLIPSGQQTATVNVVVQNGSVYSAAQNFTVTNWGPGIYSIPPGAGYAVAINNADGSIAAPIGAIPGYPTHPAKVNDVMIMYANGLGTVSLQQGNQTPAPPQLGFASLDAVRYATLYPVLKVGGVQANVIFAGLAPQFPGINQINFVVPQVSPGNNIPIQLVDGSVTTTDKVVIAIQ